MKARALGADHVATGHYVRTETDPETGRIRLRAGRGSDDQSYFLYGLSQQQLARALFPMGAHTKQEARRIARRLGLRVHDKPGSQDLCFLPEGGYRDFLRAERPAAFRSGAIVHVSGRVMGRHDGLCDYTVGQRRGLGVAHSEPLYVTALRPEQNAVVVGERPHVMRRDISLGQVNWVSVPPPEEPVKATVKIRYNHPGAPAVVEPTGPGTVRLRFERPQAAPAPGQAAVFYRGDLLLGGGTIEP
jgi:tRNA-specific 2-thiouridylase